MKNYLYLLLIPIFTLVFMSCKQGEKSMQNVSSPNQEKLSLNDTSLEKISKTDSEWKKELTKEQYSILIEKGTETPYENAFNGNHKNGYYFCAACKLPLFSSKNKFESGTGWPSFYDVLNKNRVKEVVDKSLGMVRGEIVCARCDGHLGHLFDDGPKPTGLRYCMNSAALLFQESK